MNINKIFRHSKFKSVSYYLIASVLSTLIGLVINPFLSIGLSHKDFAVIGYFTSFITLLSPIIAFSFNSYYARNYFLVDDFKREKMLQTLLSLFLVFGFVVFLLFYICYYFYHTIYITSIQFSPYALLSFLPMYFASFYNLYLLDLRMQNEAKRYAFITVLNSLIGAFFSVLLVYILKYGAEGRLFAILLVSVLFAIYSLKTKKFYYTFNKDIVKEAFSFCWPITISSFLTFFFMGIDRTFLSQLNNNHSLGLYNVGLQISGYIGVFGSVICQTFDPDLFKYASLKLNKKIFYLVILITGITMIPNLVFLVLSKPLINILTYGKYVEATSFANILCLKNVTSIFAFSLSNVLVGYGYAKFELINKLLGAFISLLLYKYLIGKYGFYGAAWGQSVSWLVMGLISFSCILYMHLKSKK
nr:oligosaccharide flippase family protein [uncultured Flavobacterium sp.]